MVLNLFTTSEKIVVKCRPSFHFLVYVAEVLQWNMLIEQSHFEIINNSEPTRCLKKKNTLDFLLQLLQM